MPTLVETPLPQRAAAMGDTTPQFRGRKSPDYSLKEANDRKLGCAAELAVLANEKKRLVDAGRPDLAEKITHVSTIEGDGAGYDIRSFRLDGTVIYIEVKATGGNSSTPFFMSANEIAFAKTHSQN
jgi:hypothetical protein